MKGELAEKCSEALGRDGLCVSVDTEPSGVDLATCYYTGETRPAADEVFHEDDTVVFVCIRARTPKNPRSHPGAVGRAAMTTTRDSAETEAAASPATTSQPRPDRLGDAEVSRPRLWR